LTEFLSLVLSDEKLISMPVVRRFIEPVRNIKQFIHLQRKSSQPSLNRDYDDMWEDMVDLFDPEKDEFFPLVLYSESFAREYFHKPLLYI
jgi:hypothetical protein